MHLHPCVDHSQSQQGLPFLCTSHLPQHRRNAKMLGLGPRQVSSVENSQDYKQLLDVPGSTYY